jgi:hypothetical protein
MAERLKLSSEALRDASSALPTEVFTPDTGTTQHKAMQELAQLHSHGDPSAVADAAIIKLIMKAQITQRNEGQHNR